MNTRSLLFISLFMLTSTMVSAQIDGFTDDFSNGSLDTLWNGSPKTLWTTNAENTFILSEGDGALNIAYSRNNASTDNDYVRFAAPEGVDMSENPRIRFSYKSTTSSTLLLRAVFGVRGGANQDETISLIGNNEWQTITINLDPEVFGDFNFNYLFFYFDQGSTSLKSGTIQIDDLKVSGFSISIPTLTAETKNGNSAALTWSSNDPDGTKEYHIHRNLQPAFTPALANLVMITTDTSFTNLGLDFNQTYFYKVVPVDTLGESYEASAEVMVQTYEPGVTPGVLVTAVNRTEVPKYEEFALDLELSNTTIFNPYDPDDIDVYAHFYAPDGRFFRINAFYDNYNSANQWRLYFAPDQVGEWSYKLFINDVSGSDSTETATFTAIESSHHGPLKLGDENPQFMVYNDGTPFYGLAVYYPWDVREHKLDELYEHGLNIIGYWNSTYDGAGNGGGYRLFESLQSGLGRYDQQKIGRIEQILGWLEERDMMMMYAIWAHPFLRDGEPGWDPIHFDYNPYKDIVDATEFYTDSLAWEYQLKNYRYLIARFAHHRSMGIWEIINEQHGTTGFIEEFDASLEWVNKVDTYLKENDPYRRPTTASFGDVDIWFEEDITADIANRHYYETQNYYTRPYNDPIHDGLFNVVNTYQGLKKSGNRPAMLGEAGYTSMFSAAGSDNYTIEFHNAFWSGLATGMASTPFWWDYTSNVIFTDDVMETYLNVKAFVEDLPFGMVQYTPVEKETQDAYIYTMQNDTSAFGWLWKVTSNFIPGTTFTVDSLETGTYELEWFNTWTGSTERIDTVVSVGGTLPLTVFDMPEPERDIAFKLHKIENGETATRLHISFPYTEITVADMPVVYTGYVFVTDEQNRLVETDIEVTLNLTGNGQLGASTITTSDGFAMFEYSPISAAGETFSLTAEATGLTSTTFNDVTITNIEHEADSDFPSDYQLNQNYPNPFNPNTIISYQLPASSLVQLTVFDISGREIATLVDDVQSAGSYQVNFNASNLSSGMYMYRLEAGSFVQARRMMLIK